MSGFRVLGCVSLALAGLVSATASCGVLDRSDDAATPPPATVTVTATGTPSRTAETTASSTPAESPSPTPTGPQDWADAYAAVKSGVVRLDVIGCDGSGGTGSGFLVAPNLVATVAHVVEGYRTVRVTSPWTGIVSAGRVIGYDHDRDLALVETDGDLPGHLFDLAEDSTPDGTEISVLGFPLGRSMQITTGNVTGGHEHRLVGGEFELSDMLLTDAAMNLGNSGGPWIDQTGHVVALAESGPPYDSNDQIAQGNNGGVSARDAAAHLARWRTEPQPLAPCGTPLTSIEAAELTLSYYFDLINTSDYESAYAQLDSSNHPLTELNAFVDDVTSTQDQRVGGDPGSWPLFDVMDAHLNGGHVVAQVRFESHQHSDQGPKGLECAEWQLRYDFAPGNGVWSIHSSSAVGDQPPYRQCRDDSGE